MTPPSGPEPSAIPAAAAPPVAAAAAPEGELFDYIIVGSGAGGGPLAARLALAGFKVLLMEAGDDHTRAPQPGGPGSRVLETEAEERARQEALEVSMVPSLHGVSTEQRDLSWQFFVKHYETQPSPQDPKWHKPDPTNGENAAHEGIFYPRAAALGGCTVHNAMITIAGPDADWDDLADFLNDPSWSGSRMRQYFQRLERNEYSATPEKIPEGPVRRGWHNFRWLVNGPGWLRQPDYSAGRHGFDGWLHTSVADISLGLRDKQLVKMLKAALLKSKLADLDSAWTLVRRFFKGRISEALDPNHARTQAESPEGVVLVPIAVCGKKTSIHQNAATPYVQTGRRSSPRELLLQVQASHPRNLTIRPNCLVTKVLLDDGNPPRAVGVEYYEQARIYRAHPNPAPLTARAKVQRVRDGGEVILCGGAFNTPQVLMLSGIGDRAQLEAHNINCRVHAPGVGANLQDRYEVTLISDMKGPFSLLENATFAYPGADQPVDPHLKEWRAEGSGLYSSNGSVLGILKRSNPHLAQPDLFIFGVPLPFEGYSVGYSKVGNIHDRFTWAILKGQTQNHDGTVQLRSADPLDTPLINFHYFNERSSPGGADNDPDLAALVDGVKFVRGIAKLAFFKVRREVHPGLNLVDVGDDRQIRDWIKRDAWGHHACGTCRMGPAEDAKAVLDTEFRVHGVNGLRVVDASIFPKIPGYFIVTNIYMASEKASDAIIADARQRGFAGEFASPSAARTGRDARLPDATSYPRGLRAAEEAAIRLRREQAGMGATTATSRPAEMDPEATAAQKSAAPSKVEDWADDVTGLGLSGGGIRSATLNLGVLQALAHGEWLRRIDILSTVSGGGYIGSFLGRFFDRFRHDDFLGTRTARSASERVERELVDPDSKLIAWLRRHGNYIAPSGEGDARLNFATFLRNLLSMHFVVGVLLFAVFGLANAVRYGVFDPATTGFNLAVVNRGELPLGHLLQSVLGAFYSPWFVLFELLVLFLVLPRMVGYWLASQDRHRRFQGPPLALLFLIGGGLLFLGVVNGLRLEPVFLGVALFTSLAHVELAWHRGRNREQAVGTGGVETQRLRTRNLLTYDLGLALALAVGALGFAIIDTIAHGLQQWLLEKNFTYTQAFAAFGGALAALLPVARWLATVFAGGKKAGGPPSTMARIFRRQATALLLAVVLFTVPLILYSFAAHAVFLGGSALFAGIIATAAALVISLILTHPRALVVVNRSSLAQTYAARLARAYLGASNPLRHRPDGGNITEVIGGDDVSAVPDYRPHETGGPLHLINVTVNQTVDFTSQRGNRDRKGENLAVSCLGVSIGEHYHALWQPTMRDAVRTHGRKQPTPLIPVGHVPGLPHPLVDESGKAAACAEMLSLRQWIAISGAAISPGRGQTTRLGTALLFGLANLRTGYWWDSGIADAEREGFPQLNFFRRFLYLLPRLFITQALIAFEWVARFPGPWERYWFISDGGFFENLAGYELIRRRIPRIILCDAGADPTYECDDLANLIRKARIDFDACIEPFTLAELDRHVGPEQSGTMRTRTATLRDYIGTLDELKPIRSADGQVLAPSSKHAALFWVRYLCQSGCVPPRRSVLLYLKATVTGDETADVQHYHAVNREFPHEATGDQFFDEAQWESYRQLGEHMGSPLFEDRRWFWAIPLDPPPMPAPNNPPVVPE